jgi:hypothetical protein
MREGERSGERKFAAREASEYEREASIERWGPA